jgi:hypothetical protein
MVGGVDAPLKLVNVALVNVAAVQVLKLRRAHRADENPTDDDLLRDELGHRHHQLLLLLVLDHRILLVGGKRQLNNVWYATRRDATRCYPGAIP